MLKILRKIAHWIREIVTIRFLLNVNNDEQCREKHAHIFVSQHSRHTHTQRKRGWKKTLKYVTFIIIFSFEFQFRFYIVFPFSA